MRRSIIALLFLLAILSSAIALAAAPRIPVAAPAVLQPAIITTEAPTSHPTTSPNSGAADVQNTVTASAPPASQPATTTAIVTASPTAAETAITPTATSSLAQGYVVRFHPDGGLYVGDQVSFEVVAPPDLLPAERSVLVELPNAEGDEHPQAQFGPHGIGARMQADLLWVWNTAGLAPGSYELGFSVMPGGPSWQETVTLAPNDERPAGEAQARWEQVSTTYSRINFITGTAAERDIAEMSAIIDGDVQSAAGLLGVDAPERIEMTLLPRVLGHGGFAGREIAISYLDRNYIGGEEPRIIHHEIVHILDGRLGGELRPSALVEGLAVYLSGGHFKEENLLPRAAALLPPQANCVLWSPSASEAEQGCGLGQFIPLERLIDNFYHEQHEVGYLEAGALIAYMVDRWGWQAYSDFYRDMHPVKDSPGANPSPGKQSTALNVALKKHFELDLTRLEQDFLKALENQHVSPHEAEDLRLSLLHFDTARRYQAMLDPSAHFLTAWLLDTREMQSRQITADYLRRPTQPENLALETMLGASSENLLSGDFATTASLLGAANRVMDAYPTTGLQAFSTDRLAADYLALVQLALAQGYDPQRIMVDNETARVWVSTSGSELVELTLARQADEWTLLTSGSALDGPWFYGVQDQRMPLSASNGGWQYRLR